MEIWCSRPIHDTCLKCAVLFILYAQKTLIVLSSLFACLEIRHYNFRVKRIKSSLLFSACNSHELREFSHVFSHCSHLAKRASRRLHRKFRLLFAVLDPFPSTTAVTPNRAFVGSYMKLSCQPPNSYPTGYIYWATPQADNVGKLLPIENSERVTHDYDGECEAWSEECLWSLTGTAIQWNYWSMKWMENTYCMNRQTWKIVRVESR